LTRRFTRLAAAVLVALAAAAAAVAAPGTPDVSQMALRSTDIPGAKVTSQGVEDVDQGYEAGYSRSLAALVPVAEL
jgi:peptidoglycan/LPS O-acetylase OafA/YrhL